MRREYLAYGAMIVLFGGVVLWATEALCYATFYKLDLPGGEIEQAVARLTAHFDGALQGRTDTVSTFGYLLLTRNRSHPGLTEARNEMLLHPPNWYEQDLHRWYAGSNALALLDDRKGDAWEAWNQRMRSDIFPRTVGDKSWHGGDSSTGNVVRASLIQLTSEAHENWWKSAGR